MNTDFIKGVVVPILTIVDEDEKIDEARLAKGEYKIGIIFASSKDGATFEGAPGSTLLIDEVELIYE